MMYNSEGQVFATDGKTVYSHSGYRVGKSEELSKPLSLIEKRTVVQIDARRSNELAPARSRVAEAINSQWEGRQPPKLGDMGLATTGSGSMEVPSETHLSTAEIERIEQAREALSTRENLTPEERMQVKALEMAVRELSKPDEKNREWVKGMRDSMGPAMSILVLTSAALALANKYKHTSADLDAPRATFH